MKCTVLFLMALLVVTEAQWILYDNYENSTTCSTDSLGSATALPLNRCTPTFVDRVNITIYYKGSTSNGNYTYCSYSDSQCTTLLPETTVEVSTSNGYTRRTTYGGCLLNGIADRCVPSPQPYRPESTKITSGSAWTTPLRAKDRVGIVYADSFCGTLWYAYAVFSTTPNDACNATEADGECTTIDRGTSVRYYCGTDAGATAFFSSGPGPQIATNAGTATTTVTVSATTTAQVQQIALTLSAAYTNQTALSLILGYILAVPPSQIVFTSASTQLNVTFYITNYASSAQAVNLLQAAVSAQANNPNNNPFSQAATQLNISATPTANQAASGGSISVIATATATATATKAVVVTRALSAGTAIMASIVLTAFALLL